MILKTGSTVTNNTVTDDGKVEITISEGNTYNIYSDDEAELLQMITDAQFVG